MAKTKQNKSQNVTTSNGDNLSPTEKKALNKDEVVNKAFEFIKNFEGYRLTAYWDSKHYSIGFGTSSFAGEQITYEEAEKRAKERINDIITKRDFMSLNDEGMIIALTSFSYNVGSPPKGYKRYINNNYKQALKNLMKQYCHSGGKRLRGLANRRNAETNLF